jgi:hypothetical protein
MTEADAARIEQLEIENHALRIRAERALQGLWGVLKAQGGEVWVDPELLERAAQGGHVQCWQKGSSFLFKALEPGEPDEP